MASIVFLVTVTVVLPIGGCAYAVYKRRFLPFLLGVLAFVVSQTLLRIPLLEYLEAKSGTYLLWSVKSHVLFVIFLAFTAGIFEESARWIAMKYFMKQRDRLSGILFGIGHGGIEAFLIVGLPFMASMSTVLSQSVYWLGGFERMIAVCIHIGLSLIVLKAVKSGRFSFVLLAIGIHGAVNSVAGLLSFFSFVTPLLIESVLLILAIITLFIAYFLFRKEEEI